MPAFYPENQSYINHSKRNSSKHLINEQEIINASKKDSANFKVIYEHYFNAILNYINQRVNDPPTSADITSNTFLKALMNIKKYKPMEVPFSAWLYKIAYNETMMFFRKSKNLRHVPLDDVILENIGEEIPGIEKEQLLNAVMKTLNELEHTDTELIDLKYFQKKSGKEIAFILGLSESNVKVKLHRLLKRVKTLTLKNHE